MLPNNNNQNLLGNKNGAQAEEPKVFGKHPRNWVGGVTEVASRLMMGFLQSLRVSTQVETTIQMRKTFKFLGQASTTQQIDRQVAKYSWGAPSQVGLCHSIHLSDFVRLSSGDWVFCFVCLT